MKTKLASVGMKSFLVLAFAIPAPALWAASPVDVCRTDNNKAHNEIMVLFTQAKAKGNISPDEEKAFVAMEGRLKLHVATLARDGLTLPECKAIQSELAVEKATIIKMAAAPAIKPPIPGQKPIAPSPSVAAAQVAACIAENNKAHAEILMLFTQAKVRGNISPDEGKAFSAMEGRLRLHQTALAKSGLTISECRMIQSELAVEKAMVIKMAAAQTASKPPTVIKAPTPFQKPIAPVPVPAPVTNAAQIKACIVGINNTHTEIKIIFTQAKAKGNISPDEEKAFRTMEDRQKTRETSLAKAGLTIAECKAIQSELVGEKAVVMKMATGR